MKPSFAVVTASSLEYSGLAALTDPSKESYALLHGYLNQFGIHNDPSRIAWERVQFWRSCLERADWMFWTGCDAMITNQNIRLESFVDEATDFVFAVDGGGLQCDSFLMRNCDACREFLDNVLTWEGKVPNEQEAMNLELSGEMILANFHASMPCKLVDGGLPATAELVQSLQKALNRSPVRSRIVSQRQLNAYDQRHYLGTGDELYSWHPGDFVQHLPGKSLEYRLKAFKELLQAHPDGSQVR